MDPLGNVIGLLRPHAAVSKPIEGRGQWGVRYEAHGSPGFAIVLAGHCWLELEDAGPVRLDRGDFVLLPATPAFALSSRPGFPCIPVQPSDSAVRHGDPEGEADFRMLGGSFRIDEVNAALLLGLLPRMIHLRAAAREGDRLTGIIDLIVDECEGDRAAREMVLERLLEIMLVECLRQGPGAEALPAGLLAGLRDPALARVLRTIHGDVRTGWTVARLAGLAAMSRSSFAARFADTLGCAPIEYLSRWRMALARDALSRGGQPLERLAEQIGYESASAFSTAFRKHMGCAPGAFARACRDRLSAGRAARTP
ncbi:MAG: AraC family transcriptional regulator [Sphingomonadaceae bacterium]|nr:AraC family transcriptional regulator [Sphingomonadaceae bacterium]